MAEVAEVVKIGLTGVPGVGKTETLLKIVRRLEEKGIVIGGMVTEPIIENNQRMGFSIIDWRTKKQGMLAHRDFDSEIEVGGYRVNVKDLEEVGVPAILDAVESCDLVVVDEVGKMEMCSEKFIEAVKKLLDSDRCILMTLHKKSRHPLLQDIRRRDDVRIIEVTRMGKTVLYSQIAPVFEEYFEKHKR
ncbi:MAG: NTPase [Candidatus Thermoplasmatota archaeon]|nr:NTPase [Candidatus Thermoplasmatota archaeon]